MSSLLARLPPPPPGCVGWPWTEETPPSTYAGDAHVPRISIVTPSFNQGSYIEETIRSILLQNYPNLQYMVIDGGSTDDTVRILERYAPWLTHWESGPDRGQSHAINKGLSHCDGVWFNWINSDDCLLPGALASVGRVADPSVSIISGAEITGATLSDTSPLGRTRIAANLEDTLVNHYICQQGLFFRTSLVRSLGGVREDLHYIMDLELLARVILTAGLGAVHEIGEDLAFFRRHDEAKTEVASDRFKAEERDLFRQMATALEVHPDLLSRILPGEGPMEKGSTQCLPLERIDRDRFSRLLSQKFWWNDHVEVAWRDRDFETFKKEVVSFFRLFPGVTNSRVVRLRGFSRLPTPVLRMMSCFRVSG